MLEVEEEEDGAEFAVDADDELSELDFEPLSPDEEEEESLLPSLLLPSLLLAEASPELPSAEDLVGADEAL